MGSSPRVWGQVAVKFIFITNCQDHPHAYGDKGQYKAKQGVQRGSSPRVWGQVLWYAMLAVVTGIIPTRMGTSITSKNFFILLKDHPHAYGDKSIVTPATFVVKGSSPRVWGQVIGDLDTSAKLGIIPTRMGTRRLILLPSQV